jgi:Derlin-2/3
MAIQSLLVYGGVMSADWIWFDPRRMFFKLPPQVWRLATSFLLTGPRLDFIFDLYFTWTYGTGLELNSPRFSQPGSFFVYVVFVCTISAVSRACFFGFLASFVKPRISARPASDS